MAGHFDAVTGTPGGAYFKFNATARGRRSADAGAGTLTFPPARFSLRNSTYSSPSQPFVYLFGYKYILSRGECQVTTGYSDHRVPEMRAIGATAPGYTHGGLAY